MINKTYHEMVKEFHKAFIHPVGTEKSVLLNDRDLARINWMQEELDEYAEANTLVDKVDALVDLTYFIMGTLVEMGISQDEFYRCFEAVHTANMKKLWTDGKPHYKPDGKVKKPEGWEKYTPEPIIEEILNGTKS